MRFSTSEHWSTRLARWVAWHLPRKVVLWAMIRVVAHATTGRYGSEHVDQIGYKEMHDRWEMSNA